MGFRYVQLGDNDPVRVSDEESVVSVFEARGFKRVDDPTTAGVADTSVEAAEVDDHGIGWVYVEQTIDGTLRSARIPLEPGVLEDHRDKGWRLAGETETPKKKTAKKTASKSTAGDETPEEK